MTKIWGRKDGSNVIKVLWCLGELGIEYERIDWGGSFGGNDDPDYRRKNPNGRLPTLEEDDGFCLWESGAIMRYLCAGHSIGELYPQDLRARAAADKWMDWSSLYLAGFNASYLDHHFRLPETERSVAGLEQAVDKATPWFDMLDAHLAENTYIGGEGLTMADFPTGSLLHRWVEWSPRRPSHPNLDDYYERLLARPAYLEHVVEANAHRTQQAHANVGKE
jgi:glutathione S-transferase